MLFCKPSWMNEYLPDCTESSNYRLTSPEFIVIIIISCSSSFPFSLWIESGNTLELKSLSFSFWFIWFFYFSALSIFSISIYGFILLLKLFLSSLEFSFLAEESPWAFESSSLIAFKLFWSVTFVFWSYSFKS